MSEFSKILKIDKHLIAFSFIGIFNVLFAVFMYYLLLDVWGVNIYLAQIVSFFIGTGLAYLLNAKFNFDKEVNFLDLLSYYASYSVSSGVNFIIVVVLKNTMYNLTDFQISLIALTITIFIPFILIRLFIFKD